MVVKVFNKMVTIPNSCKNVSNTILVNGSVYVGDTELMVKYIEKEFDRWVFKLDGIDAILNNEGLFIVSKGGLN